MKVVSEENVLALLRAVNINLLHVMISTYMSVRSNASTTVLRYKRKEDMSKKGRV